MGCAPSYMPPPPPQKLPRKHYTDPRELHQETFDGEVGAVSINDGQSTVMITKKNNYSYNRVGFGSEDRECVVTTYGTGTAVSVKNISDDSEPVAMAVNMPLTNLYVKAEGKKAYAWSESETRLATIYRPPFVLSNGKTDIVYSESDVERGPVAQHAIAAPPAGTQNPVVIQN